MKLLTVFGSILVASLALAYPQKSDLCDLKCSRIYKPVCGSNGKTYNSECLLEREKCVKRLFIQVARTGACDDNIEGLNVDETLGDVSAEVISARENDGCDMKCTREFKPVCGSDGQTYNNECLLNREKCVKRLFIQVSKQGSCDTDDSSQGENCDIKCTREFKPVCGTDGRTYNNECLLNREKCTKRLFIQVSKQGGCDVDSNQNENIETEVIHSINTEKNCDIKCTREFKPVCGSDGQTYNNVCLLNREKCVKRVAIQVAKQGACDVDGRNPENNCDVKCTREFKPVCGSDGQTYNNECLLNLEKCTKRAVIEIATQGACDVDDNITIDENCEIECTREFKPVCGSDGQTYNNECLLNREKCVKRIAIQVDRQGTCDAESNQGEQRKTEVIPGRKSQQFCDNKCTREFKPVCGSDGKTYNNECLLEREKCVKRLFIQVASKGSCEKNKNEQDSAITEEMLGKSGKKEMFVSKRDEDCPVKCTRELRPVCGSDGKTHTNECIMRETACRQRSSGGSNIRKLHNGRCGQVVVTPKEDAQGNCAKECTRNFKPVCGSNGKTYNNLCLLENEACTKHIKITKASDGTCAEGCRNFCPLIFKAVCGSDGNTYGNECQLKSKACRERSNLDIAYSGACKPGKGSPSTTQNPTTTFNPRRATLRTPSSCAETCPTKLDLMCGSDGVTYTNLCNLNAVACQTGEDIKIVSNGKCRVIEAVEAEPEDVPARPPPVPLAECSIRCPQLFQPICASNGETFNNACELEVANCKGQNLKQVSVGACPPPPSPTKPETEAIVFEDLASENQKPCPDICSQEYDPVCGNDDFTYSNVCHLKVAACKNNTPGLAIAYNGKCAEKRPIFEAVEAEQDFEKDCDAKRCTLEINPICGSDGHVYENPCLFNKAVCKDANLTKAQDESICGDQ